VRAAASRPGATESPAVARSGGPAVALVTGLVIALGVGGCAGNRDAQPDNGAADQILQPGAAMVEATAVLVRGRIGPEAIGIEPVLQSDARPTVLPSDGAHRLWGVDDAGDVLFDFRFDGTHVADLPAGREEHFQFVIDVGPPGGSRLETIELRAGDGRHIRRQARLSARALADALAADDTFVATALDAGRVSLRWDGEMFPLVLVRDPESKRVLALAEGGEVTIQTGGRTLEIVASDGVRSGARRIDAR
jgi:hypothetical protein